jgi:hypothetical protein
MTAAASTAVLGRIGEGRSAGEQRRRKGNAKGS